MNQRHARFVREYIVDLNATQAAERAGYSKKTAYSQGHRLLKNAEILDAIAKEKAKRRARLEVTQDRVVQELARIAFVDIREIAEVTGDGVRLKPSEGWSDDAAACVESVSQSANRYGKNVTAKLASKTKALELLGRHLGIFEPDLERLTDEVLRVRALAWPDLVNEVAAGFRRSFGVEPSGNGKREKSEETAK